MKIHLFTKRTSVLINCYIRNTDVNMFTQGTFPAKGIIFSVVHVLTANKFGNIKLCVYFP